MKPRFRHKVFWFLLFVVITGCSNKRVPVGAPGTPITDRQAQQLAEQIVRTNEKVDHVEADSVVRKPDGTLEIYVWRLPKVFGGYYVLRLSPTGKLIGYEHGL